MFRTRPARPLPSGAQSYGLIFENAQKLIEPRNAERPVLDGLNAMPKCLSVAQHFLEPVCTNLPFKDWDTIFPNATSLCALIDRLIESCTVVSFEGLTYRVKLHQERASKRKKGRAMPIKK